MTTGGSRIWDRMWSGPFQNSSMTHGCTELYFISNCDTFDGTSLGTWRKILLYPFITDTETNSLNYYDGFAAPRCHARIMPDRENLANRHACNVDFASEAKSSALLLLHHSPTLRGREQAPCGCCMHLFLWGWRYLRAIGPFTTTPPSANQHDHRFQIALTVSSPDPTVTTR